MRQRSFRRATDVRAAPTRIRRWMRESKLDHDVAASRIAASMVAWLVVVRTRVREILWELDPSNAELGFSGLTMFLGGDLLLVDHVFAKSPSYAGLAFFAGERWWGLVLVALGVAQFVGCVFEQPRTRTAAHLAALWLWSFVSYCFAADAMRRGAYGGWSAVLFPLFALASLWLFARVPAVRWRRRPGAGLGTAARESALGGARDARSLEGGAATAVADAGE